MFTHITTKTTIWYRMKIVTNMAVDNTSYFYYLNVLRYFVVIVPRDLYQLWHENVKMWLKTCLIWHKTSKQHKFKIDAFIGHLKTIGM